MLESILTWGRNIGFTGRMAVLEGKTFRVEKPNCAPLRARAALAESVGINQMRDKKIEDQIHMQSHSKEESVEEKKESLHSSENSTKAKRRLECGSPQIRQSATCKIDRRKISRYSHKQDMFHYWYI